MPNAPHYNVLQETAGHEDPGISKMKPPRFLELRSSTGFILLVAFVAIFADVFLYGLVVPTLPYVLHKLLQVGPEETQVWVAILLSVYGAADVFASPVFGYVADRGDTRRVSFMSAILAMAAAMLFFALSTSRVLLVLARVLQGTAAAGVWTVALAVVVDTVEPSRIGNAMGYMSLALTSGNLLGPMCGGIIFDHGGFRAITITAISLVALAALLRLVMIEVQSKQKWQVEGGLAEDIRQSNYYGTFNDETAPTEPNGTAISDASEDSIIVSPFRKTLSFLFSGRFIVIMIGICTSSAFYSAFDSILPLQTISVFKWSSTGSGLVFLPLSLPSLLSPILGRAVDTYGTRIVALCGFGFGLPCFVILGFVQSNTLEHKILLCATLFATGACLMAQTVPLMTEVSKVIDRKDESAKAGAGNGSIAMGYGLFNVAYAGGILIGAVLGGFLNETAGWRFTTLILGLLSGGTAIPFWLNNEIGLPPDDFGAASLPCSSESRSEQH